MEITRAIIEARETPAVYVLTNGPRDYFYKGATRNLKERLKDHAAGRVSRTKNKRPLFFVYMEYCNTYSEALIRERYFKSGTGRTWLKCRIQSGQTVPPEADVPQAQNLLANAFGILRH